MAYAERVFRAARRTRDGASEHDHAAARERILARMGKPPAPPAKEEPECPESLTYLWLRFAEIAPGLAGTGWGPAVVTWRDLEAWRAVTGGVLAPWEARVLVRLGALRAEILGATVHAADDPR
jgi:hypothetical protein